MDHKQYMKQIGKKGGSAGKGKAKSRGDSKYYSDLAAKRKKKPQKP